MSVCVFVRRRTQGLNQSTISFKIDILRPLANISSGFFSFLSTPKIKGSLHNKKLKISIFSKMAPTISIKFCELIVDLKPNNVILSALSGKIPGTDKYFFKFVRLLS